jgi:predicted unusual protein kinase regulating ubiquinone biosynthesis (AarF/ABC1/UbiB family)
MADKLPTGRVGRLARVGTAAAGQAVKRAGTRTANLTRSDEQAAAAMDQRQLEAAEQIVTVLGGMKGAAMKLGQVLSFVDLGIVPPEHRERFQAKLATLRDSAPTVGFEEMHKVIEEDLEAPVSELFSDFDPEPIAAASIGQVYRASLSDGREVAVKVQYPGIGDAVRADMKNLGVLLRLVRSVTPELDTKAVGNEIRERIVEELDYELEASNQRTMARIYEGHPFIAVPAVVTSLCRERVIVSEFVAGESLDAIREKPAAERDRIGEILFRFYFGSMYRHRRFSGDPHPGNMIGLPDGRVAFLDFGLFKTIDRSVAELELGCQRATIDGDAIELHRLMSEAGFLPRPDRIDPDELLAFVRDGIWWYTTDESIRIDQEIVNHAFIQTTDMRSTHFNTARHQDILPEHLFGRRLELLTLAVLGQLEAEANWHRIAREWIYGDPPVTDLGRAEAEWAEAKRVGAKGTQTGR